MKKSPKNAEKTRNLLAALKKRLDVPPSAQVDGALEHLVLSVLRHDTDARGAWAGLETLREEFVDFNEMRVAPLKDLHDVLPADLPGRRQKAGRAVEALGKLYDHGNVLDLRHAEGMAKRELRNFLRETLGMDSYGEAYLLIHVFDMAAVPVDTRLLTKLKSDSVVGEEATVDDARALLERGVTVKNARMRFELLAQYAAEPIRKKAGKAPKAPKAKSAKAAKASGKGAGARKPAKAKTGGKAKATETGGKAKATKPGGKVKATKATKTGGDAAKAKKSKAATKADEAPKAAKAPEAAKAKKPAKASRPKPGRR